MNKISISLLGISVLIFLLLSGCTTTNNYIDRTVTKTITSTVTRTVTQSYSGITTTANPPAPSTSAAPNTTTSSPAAPVSYSIGEALAQDLISIKVNGYAGTSFLGVSSGDVIAVSFLRHVPQTLNIIVPMGTTLICDNSETQNMVILSLKGRDPSVLGYYPVDEIILNKDEWQNFLFEAYCMNINKDNIHNSTTFSVGDLASENIIAILSEAREIGSEKASVSAIQIALWAHIDNPSFDAIQERFNIDQETMAAAWDILDGAGLNPGSLGLFVGYTPG